MIEVLMGDGAVRYSQRLTHPSVYLDHWALLDFSQDEKLGRRLTETIKTRHGTLALSWLNLLEYSKVSEEAQARQAELLFENNLPHLFFLDTQPFRVISREDVFISGSSKAAPHGNEGLLREFSNMTPASPTSVFPFSCHNMFRYSQDS
jgi:hypothetical protein